MARRSKRGPKKSPYRSEHDRWCIMCRGEDFEFVDETLTCRKCGEDFVFSAEQQYYWYVTLNLWQAAKPPRLCRTCGRARRAGRELQTRLTEASLAARQRPDDPAALLALAAATADHVAHFRRGSGAPGIAAARRVRSLDPRNAEAHFWEAACHDAAGRHGRAAACYERFVAEVGNVRRLRKLVGRASQRAYELRSLDEPGDAAAEHAAGP